jgi:hypothetical protein
MGSRNSCGKVVNSSMLGRNWRAMGSPGSPASICDRRCGDTATA